MIEPEEELREFVLAKRTPMLVPPTPRGAVPVTRIEPDVVETAPVPLMLTPWEAVAAEEEVPMSVMMPVVALRVPAVKEIPWQPAEVPEEEAVIEIG